MINSTDDVKSTSSLFDIGSKVYISSYQQNSIVEAVTPSLFGGFACFVTINQPFPYLHEIGKDVKTSMWVHESHLKNNWEVLP